MGHNKRPIDNPRSYAHFILDKGIKNIHWEKRQPFNNVVQTGYPPEEEQKENHMFHHAQK